MEVGLQAYAGVVVAAKKKKKPAKKKAPAVKKPVPLNELYPDATKIRWLQNELKKRSK